MTRVLGIDPGITGALALLDTELGMLEVHDIPIIKTRTRGTQITESHFADLVYALRPDAVWIEQVHAMPRQGVSSSFNFGVAYGIARGVCASWPLHLITSSQWKRPFHLTSDKSLSRRLASRLYPTKSHLFARVKDDGRAEAVLIATYGANLLTK